MKISVKEAAFLFLTACNMLNGAQAMQANTVETSEEDSDQAFRGRFTSNLTQLVDDARNHFSRHHNRLTNFDNPILTDDQILKAYTQEIFPKACWGGGLARDIYGMFGCVTGDLGTMYWLGNFLTFNPAELLEGHGFPETATFFREIFSHPAIQEDMRQCVPEGDVAQQEAMENRIDSFTSPPPLK